MFRARDQSGEVCTSYLSNHPENSIVFPEEGKGYFGLWALAGEPGKRACESRLSGALISSISEEKQIMYVGLHTNTSRLIIESSMPSSSDPWPAPRLDREHDHARGRDGEARRRDEQGQANVDREHEPGQDGRDDPGEAAEGRGDPGRRAPGEDGPA